MFLNLKKTTIFVLSMLLSCYGFAQISIIPKPAELTMKQGTDSFVISSATVIVVEDKSIQPVADFFNDYIKQVYGFTLKTGKKNSANDRIVLSVAKGIGTVAGAYTMDIDKVGVTVKGNDESGVFYGMQTLLQLLPVQKTQQLHIPLVQIKDTPRYQYRGMMLDVARHFFPVEFVKKYIDEHFTDPASLDGLSKQFGINEFKLKHGFKVLFDTSPMRYLQNKRLAYSLTLLRETDMSIKSIADEIGYAHAANFTIAFTKSFGRAPVYYRNGRR